MAASLPVGVITSDALLRLFGHTREHGYAIPAFDCMSSSAINAILEAARDAKSSVVIQLSNVGSAFYAGKGVKNVNEHAARGHGRHRGMARGYGVTVVLHSDCCARTLLPWLDAVIEADEDYFALHGEPLFSSHALDLSEARASVMRGCARGAPKRALALGSAAQARARARVPTRSSPRRSRAPSIAHGTPSEMCRPSASKPP